MNQKDVHTIIEKQVKSTNLKSLMSQIMLKEGFCLKIKWTYEPLQQFITLLLLYFSMRQRKNGLSEGYQVQVSEIQLKISTKLKSYNFNFDQKQKTFDESFNDKIVILSLMLSHFMTSLNKKLALELINLEDYFISLLYLATGKFVSLKCFQFWRDKMRKKNANKFQSVFPSIKYIKKQEQAKLKRTFYKSQIEQFKEELRNVLRTENHPKTIFCSHKHFYIKLSSKKSNADPQKTKKKFTQLNLNQDIGSKERSKTITSNACKIKHRASVDQMLQKQNQSKTNNKNLGVRFLLQKQSLASGPSYKTSFNLLKSEAHLNIC